MTLRFGRSYRLVITFQDNKNLILTSGLSTNKSEGLRIAFDGTKSLIGGTNSLNIKIYNLKKDNYTRLQKDESDITINIGIELSIGYQDKIGLIFKGIVHRAAPSRDGADYITMLECLDNFTDRTTAQISKTVTNTNEALNQITATFKNLKRGQITDKLVNIKKPLVLAGKSFDQLEKLLLPDKQYNIYIDDDKLYILEQGEVITNAVVLIDSNSGLKADVERQQKKVTFSTLLNPDLRLGGLCKLNSEIMQSVNDVYKIQQIEYIGDTRGAEWTQKITAFSIANPSKVL